MNRVLGGLCLGAAFVEATMHADPTPAPWLSIAVCALAGVLNLVAARRNRKVAT